MAPAGFMYILRCADGSFYVGSTSNLEQRLSAHELGEGGDYTRRRLPVTLVYSEEYPSAFEAFLREREVKGWSRAKKLALIRGEFEKLPQLSKSRQGRRASPQPRPHPSTGSG
jgi:putative endonuclease